MIPTGPIPDALFVPVTLKQGRTQHRADRLDRLGSPSRSWGSTATAAMGLRSDRQGDGWLFVTTDPQDTLYFPLNTPFRGRPRYHWLDGADGIRRGHLVPEAMNDRRESEA